MTAMEAVDIELLLSELNANVPEEEKTLGLLEWKRLSKTALDQCCAVVNRENTVNIN